MACTQSTEQAMDLPPPSPSYCSLTLSFFVAEKINHIFPKSFAIFVKELFSYPSHCNHRMQNNACMMKAFIIIIIIIIFFFERIFAFWWQKSGGANDTTNFLSNNNNNNNNGPKSPHYDNVEMFFLSHHIWTIGSNVPTCHHNRGRILAFFYFPL
jgi:hypothetical protein